MRSVFPAFFPGSRSLREGHGSLDHDGFSFCSPSAIRLLPGVTGFTCYDAVFQGGDVLLHWVINFQHPFVNLEAKTTGLLLTIDGTMSSS